MGHNIITIANPKGGVSKSTTAGHLSMSLAQKGRVCAVDFDRQKDLSKMFFLSHPDSFYEHANTLTLINFETSLEDTIKNKYGVDVVVGSPRLRDFSMLVAKDITFLDRAKEILRDPIIAAKYDYIIIDTPGTGIFETTSAVLASDIVIIPVTPARWSLDTLKDFFKDLNDAIKSGSYLSKIFILPSLWGNSAEKEEIYDQLLQIPNVLEDLKKMEPGFELLPKPIILNPIPSSDSIRKRSEFAEPLGENTIGKIAFDKLADRIVKECSNKNKELLGSRLAR
ncbi:ParA family protein [Leptospira santarosai]|uniref:CobQ/CobB/MinD/ParA nucleotide binding domain protein n=1 Tax=Leptospira santarosai str. CBC1416 TaxID=1193059 RepID=M6VKZ4_9LEPT|nr:ParA family protein [Leptospira santarosai]EMJ45859.1 CobQ/CobB/MinD/ParA nucleotide binding domain protein [Leptospira santarosai str. HAI1349]EMO58137.1 CobQ/CobB/MinD/ParA nucleotide binding domain protein [Leptospira santarosai str. CBC1416]MDI7157306.1 ParA family protein [Leptospira santarosai]MDI7182832.1 ParA family protein [Leptospira santarosai]